MVEVKVAAVSAFADPDGKVFEIGDREVGVFHVGGEFRAWENHCPHLGGPACQGIIMPLTHESIQPDRTSTGRQFDRKNFNIVCPWHGFEFDIRTGRHPTNSRVRLKPVELRVDRDDIYVIVNAEA